MSAKPQPRTSDALLPSNEFSAVAEEAPQPALKVISETPLPLAEFPQASAASDPLHAIKAMSEEEKIALCS